MTKKASFADRMKQSKPNEIEQEPLAPVVTKTVATKKAPAATKPKQTSRTNKIPLTTFVDRGAPVKQFKMMCIEEDKNQQELLNAMINEYMEKRGKPGIY